MTCNEQGKRTSLENLAGRIATKVAQGKGGLGLRTDMAYTVKHIQKGQALLAHRFRGTCSVLPRYAVSHEPRAVSLGPPTTSH